MRANLTTQGYCLSDDERRGLAVGLRFSTGLCLTLVVVALVLESPVMVFALSAIGLVAGFSACHPFDQLWNHVVRRAIGGPPLPPNPARRRDQGRHRVAARRRHVARHRCGDGRTDPRRVEDRVKRMYEEVALEPEREFHSMRPRNTA